jgi:pimeloyl-ACP methyl ester carboxylesterase
MLEERRIEADGAQGRVPGRLTLPSERGAGLLLLGHGGGGSKDAERFVALARRYARGTGLAVLCIDGPAHGERAPRTGSREEDFRRVRRALASRASSEQMVGDWQAAAALAEKACDTGPAVAYAGFSMGMLFGAPTVAAMRAIRAAVFGVGGIPRPGGIEDLIRAVAGERAAQITAEETPSDQRVDVVLESAPRLDHCEVLMLNTTMDEVFPPEGALRFFAAIPGRRKRIAFWEGRHVELPAEAIDLSVEFLCRALDRPAPSGASSSSSASAGASASSFATG